jgi:oxygen-independent coproporphyrinogen-3 oxidase
MYTNALLQEIRLVKQQRNLGRIPLRSIYFGGGTPSLAPVDTLQQILAAILDEESSPFIITENCEITIEMDPGTFDIDKLREVRAMGFNRISLGVQSFDDNILKSLGRVHTSSDIWESLSMLETVFGSNLNYSMDLISGLPGLSLAKWVETLQTAVHVKPRPVHLSIYDLQIESVSVFMLLHRS